MSELFTLQVCIYLLFGALLVQVLVVVWPLHRALDALARDDALPVPPRTARAPRSERTQPHSTSAQSENAREHGNAALKSSERMAALEQRALGAVQRAHAAGTCCLLLFVVVFIFFCVCVVVFVSFCRLYGSPA